MLLTIENTTSCTHPMTLMYTPIESITLVPTAGEMSPTSVVVDVTAACPSGVSELKRIQRYSNQLFIPEEMILGNDLIKVWNIDDERQVNNENCMDITLKEEATYNKAATTASIEAPKDKQTAVPIMMNVDNIDSKLPSYVTSPISVPGTTKTVVISFDEEEEKERPTRHERSHRGHVGHHRRSQSHFDFGFQ